MDEKISSHIREIVLDAVRRQRPQPDSEAAKRQMLVSTLRLAGHTVSVIANDPTAPGDGAQGDDTAPTDDAMPVGEMEPPDGTAQISDIAPQDDIAPPAVVAPRRTGATRSVALEQSARA